MKSASKIEARAADWIAQRDGNQWTEADQRAFDGWLSESAAHRVAYLRLNAAWERADRLRALRPSEPVQRSPEPLRTVPPAQRPKRGVILSYRAAAAIAVIAIASSVTIDFSGPEVSHQYATPIGAREIVALPDGSNLTLNTATQLSTRLGRSERTVWLEKGEAFFDVAHDASRPFVILAGDRRVTVVGTKFSLRRDGDRLKVDVVEGRVQVQVGNSPATMLTRGDSAVGEGKSVLVTRQTERQSIAAISWLEGRLVFDQMTIAEAATQFNRYNQRKLIVADPAAGSIRIGGTFDASNVEGFARLVQSGFGLTIDLRDDRIVISSVAQ